MADIHHLHRGRAVFDPRPNLNDTFAESLQRDDYAKPGMLDSIADALGSERFFGFFLGFYSGAMFCCGCLILWARVLS